MHYIKLAACHQFLVHIIYEHRNISFYEAVSYCSGWSGMFLWGQVFRPRTSPEAMDLVGQLLEYTPTRRLLPLDACVHPYFDELRLPTTRLPDGKSLPPLFSFSAAGKFFVVLQIYGMYTRAVTKLIEKLVCISKILDISIYENYFL